MEPITLFLDFDGVLHPDLCHESRHFEKRMLLEECLLQLPEVEVVISSTWRLQKSLAELRAYFSEDIAARIISTTPILKELKSIPDRFLGYPRHAECWFWQKENRAASPKWIALDDRDWLFYPMTRELIHTDRTTGMNEDIVRSIILKTQQLHQF